MEVPTNINMLHNIEFRYCYNFKLGSVEIYLNMKFSIDFHKRLHWLAILKGIDKLLLKNNKYLVQSFSYSSNRIMKPDFPKHEIVNLT